MSKDWYQDIVNFHEQVMEDNFPKKPHIPPRKLIELRGSLIIEETSETLSAMDSSKKEYYTENEEACPYCLTELADGIADSIVVLLGTAVTYGIDMRPIWNEIHRTNMLKKDGELRADGKKLKPAGWKSPEIEKEIRRQQNAT